MTENADLARAALREQRTGSLATLDASNGAPYVSLVNYACDRNHLPIFLFSRLAWHTRFLLNDQRASLMVAQLETAGDVLTSFRMTIMGSVAELPDKSQAELYCGRHPEAEAYVNFSDFTFWQMVPEKIHIIGGFGRIETQDAAQIFKPPA